jgi:hypothetical protein
METKILMEVVQKKMMSISLMPSLTVLMLYIFRDSSSKPRKNNIQMFQIKSAHSSHRSINA